MIKGNQPVYCDMETTKNEGWTLLVASVSNGWTGDQVRRQTIMSPFYITVLSVFYLDVQVLSRNANFPSLTKDFSILEQANTIKSHSKNKTFKYMLDAKVRRDWGGIWRAPIEYSYVKFCCIQQIFEIYFCTFYNMLLQFYPKDEQTRKC